MQKVFSCELRLVTSAFNRRICQPGADMQEKTSGTQGNHGGTIALLSQCAPPPPCPNNTTITPLKIPHWVMFTLNNRELKQKHFWETHVNWKWGFSLDCAFRCYEMFIVTGLSLRGEGWGFPLATMNMAVATFIAKQTKNRTKRNP